MAVTLGDLAGEHAVALLVVLRAILAAFNAHDLDAIMAYFANIWPGWATSGSSSLRAPGETRSRIRRSTAQRCGVQDGKPARSGQPRTWRHVESFRSWWQL